MPHINPNAESRREKARDRDGKFGAQPKPDAPTLAPKKKDPHKAWMAAIDPRYREPDDPELWRQVFGVGDAAVAPPPDGRARRTERRERSSDVAGAIEGLAAPENVAELDESLLADVLYHAAAAVPGTMMVPDDLRERSIADYSPSYLFTKIDPEMEIEENGNMSATVLLGSYHLDDENPDEYDPYDPYDHLDFEEAAYICVAYSPESGWKTDLFFP